MIHKVRIEFYAIFYMHAKYREFFGVANLLAISYMQYGMRGSKNVYPVDNVVCAWATQARNNHILPSIYVLAQKLPFSILVWTQVW